MGSAQAAKNSGKLEVPEYKAFQMSGLNLVATSRHVDSMLEESLRRIDSRHEAHLPSRENESSHKKSI